MFGASLILKGDSDMKKLALAATSAFALIAANGANAAPTTPQTRQFAMIPSPGAANCLKNAGATVTVHTFGPFENMEVFVHGLPPNTDFDLFTIQAPNAPFGMSWYVGDIETDSAGIGVGNFAGRFNVETFIVSPGVVPNAQVFPGDAAAGVATAPIHTYHLGLWFNSPADASKAGCPGNTTPFNGEHNAGVQALNTAQFPGPKGPLFILK